MKIQFRISFGHDKVKAIKAVRAATGLGLQEAKHFVDEGIANIGRQYPHPVVMTDAQFGRLMATVYAMPNLDLATQSGQAKSVSPVAGLTPVFTISDVQIHRDELTRDFTTLEAATSPTAPVCDVIAQLPEAVNA